MCFVKIMSLTDISNGFSSKMSTVWRSMFEILDLGTTKSLDILMLSNDTIKLGCRIQYVK